MKNTVSVSIAGIDPVLLDEQRAILSEILSTHELTDRESDAIEGVVNMLDTMSDVIEEDSE